MAQNQFSQRLEGLLSGASPIGNLSLGLLAASGPRPVGTSSFGSRLGEAFQFANQRQQAAMQNQIMRQALVQQQRQQQAQQQLAGLLSAPERTPEGEALPAGQGVMATQDMRQGDLMGLLAQANPEGFTQAMTTGLLGQMFPQTKGFESPIGKLLGDRAIAQAQGNAEGVKSIDAVIQSAVGPEVDLSKVLEVRDDVTRNSGEFLAAQAGFEKVQAAAASDSPAADMALIFGYMKVLDPGSIVREGEFATVENSAGVPERIRGLYNKILRGERLTPEQRQDFLSQAHAQYVPLVEQQQRLVRDAQSFAERNKLPFQDIVPEFVMPILPEPVSPPERGGVAAGAGGLIEDIKRDVAGLFGGGSAQPPRRLRFNPQTGQLEPR